MKRLVDQSYYELLEIPRSAAREEVERAYERAKALYGPGSLVAYTLLAPEDAEILSRRIEEARTVLLDEGARASYDARLPSDAPEPRPGRVSVPVVDLRAEPGMARPAASASPVAEAELAAEAGASAPAVPEEGAPWTGDLLRRAREGRGLSVMQISERTKVTRHHIENIELDRFEKLPAAVYLRGILMSLARELRLDSQRVARSYLDRVVSSQKPAGKHR
ncbi:MAG TPA: helix-turn-helix domain-containing protein [Anaeromyxobacteraceae bacterium]|nr:helix-turn-helix domain-containing protein [Anaeromyxobacteraceae bacterium]